MAEPNPDFVAFLQPYPEVVRSLAQQAMQFLVDRFGPAYEVYWDATQAVCAGVNYTGKDRDTFVNIAIYAQHVTLIFQDGVKLTDTEGRLRGTGSRVRNIRLTEGMATLTDPYVVDLMDQARAYSCPPPSGFEPVAIIKSMKGPKRRPS